MDTILFDLDGTLVDSMYVWEKVVQTIYDQNQIVSDLSKDMHYFHTLKISEVFSYIRAHWNTKMDEADMQAMANSILKEEYEQVIPAVPGAIEYVKEAKRAGMKLGIVTSSPMKLVKPILTRLGLFDDFALIESAEDLHLSKRDPQIFEMALAALDSEPENTLFFEDSRYALETADRLGIHGIGMKSKGEPYEDRESIVSFEERLPFQIQ